MQISILPEDFNLPYMSPINCPLCVAIKRDLGLDYVYVDIARYEEAPYSYNIEAGVYLVNPERKVLRCAYKPLSGVGRSHGLNNYLHGMTIEPDYTYNGYDWNVEIYEKLKSLNYPYRIEITKT